MKRRDVLRGSLALAGAAATTAIPAEAKEKTGDVNATKKKKKNKRNPDLSNMNVLMFITDQQRAIQHFPNGWAEQNLPGFTRLQKTGLTFNRAFCSSCMCSPSRATLFTGFFPAQHGVKYTLEEDMPASSYPQVELPLNLKNLATVMKATGRQAPYKGKWHLSKTPDGNGDWVPNDVNKYGFQRWNPPDAGANQTIDQFGGGDPDNDGRFMDDDGPVEAGKEGALDFLNSADAKSKPFFLVVSLVNPHDVLAYPNLYDQSGAGYDDSDLVGNIGLPPTVDEDLSTKPTAQAQFLQLTNGGLGPLLTDDMKRDYLNFYGNLMKESDAYLVQLLDTLEAQGMLDNTVVIGTSDHGEMGLAHGGQRQKMFNFYEETLRVPLVYSNPKLFPKPVTSNAMVSHVDFLPTMAGLFNAPKGARSKWQGVDYSKIIRSATKGKGKGKGKVQKYVVFTYDDYQCGQKSGPYVQPPNHIASIRESRYKLARYYDESGVEPDQWEMYDLKQDGLEKKNLAAPNYKRNKKQQKEYKRLRKKLADVEKTRLRPR
ncbi:MAG: sulfatase-like hydrolase/transferase [Thermomicrobiales bacterium]|nr:sulfatase-like hydrolase/transferase [Thermomicrobiales bacterium]